VQGRTLRAEAARLAGRRAALERALGEHKAALGRLLAARQAGGAPDALRITLSGDDPAEVSRKLHYLSYVSRAAAARLAAYRAGLEDLERLRRESAAKAAELREHEAAERADRDQVLAERRARRKILDRIALAIRRDRGQIQVLRADAERLARLIEELGRVIAARPRAGFARIERVPDAAAGPFSTLQGKLRLPVRGELSGRFGAPRGAGVESKGVFIRAREGEPVRAVAAGQVVFAEWMRGFGNLLIVDHGEAYLSIYANNEALLKGVGETVAAGEALATVGASGGNEQSGLYFELRHLGKAFDPMQWVNLR
jgi:septal ring factor EnvC (AmiA/AmiB activator)